MWWNGLLREEKCWNHLSEEGHLGQTPKSRDGGSGELLTIIVYLREGESTLQMTEAGRRLWVTHSREDCTEKSPIVMGLSSESPYSEEDQEFRGDRRGW